MRHAQAPQPAAARSAAGRPSEIQLKQLMLEGMRGETRSYNALLRAVTPLLMSFYGRRMHHGEADVEDLVQETLLAIHTRRSSYDEERPFTPWLFAIARHELYAHFRRNVAGGAFDAEVSSIAELVTSPSSRMARSFIGPFPRLVRSFRSSDSPSRTIRRARITRR